MGLDLKPKREDNYNMFVEDESDWFTVYTHTTYDFVRKK